MNSTFFEKWYTEEFIPHVKQFLPQRNLPEKALLICENALSQPKSKILLTSNIRVYFMKPNVTLLIQPLDQGIIESLKRCYWQKWTTELVSQLEGSTLSIHDYLKSIDLKDAIFWLAAAWNEIYSQKISAGKSCGLKFWLCSIRPKSWIMKCRRFLMLNFTNFSIK